MKLKKLNTKNEAFENIKRVVEYKDDGVESHSELPLIMKSAYDDSIETDKHLKSVTDELNKKAKSVITDNPGLGTTPKNPYTQKLKLDEGIEDFELKSVKN